MKDCTVISYPSSKNNTLLSLAESSSRYMIPFGGRFRIVDFVIRNSALADAEQTIIYSDVEDNLEEYVNHYGPFDEDHPAIKVVNREFADIKFCKHLIDESKSRIFIIYNGDNPSLIDLREVIGKYKKRKADSLLFKVMINGKPSMAYKLLVTSRKSILKNVNRIIKEKRESPNIWEMIINTMIHKGIGKSSFHAHYWPINSVVDFFNVNRELIFKRELLDLIYTDNIIKSQIRAQGHALIGEQGKITNSFMSDYCEINGYVENSIVYPGVIIGEGSVVRDSIILPFVKIGKGSRITRAIIDESSARDDRDRLNIMDSCRIGSEEENIRNNDFPKWLNSSITLIGKDATIPDGSNIGGSCFIASGLGEEYFSKKKYLYDGDSILK